MYCLAIPKWLNCLLFPLRVNFAILGETKSSFRDVNHLTSAARANLLSHLSKQQQAVAVLNPISAYTLPVK
jgi:hypothetical protein